MGSILFWHFNTLSIHLTGKRLGGATLYCHEQNEIDILAAVKVGEDLHNPRNILATCENLVSTSNPGFNAYLAQTSHVRITWFMCAIPAHLILTSDGRPRTIEMSRLAGLRVVIQCQPWRIRQRIHLTSLQSASSAAHPRQNKSFRKD